MNCGICGKSGVRGPKKPRRLPKRQKCTPRDDKNKPDDVAEPPPPTENPASDVIMEEPPGDVITDNLPDSGDSVAVDDGSEVQMSDEELACYRRYLNKKLDEYEPIWEKDMEEFEQKYNETMLLLQGAVTRLTDNLSLWRNEWRHLSDAEKLAFCSPSSPEAEAVDPAAAQMETPPPAAESCETAEATTADTAQLAPSADDDAAAAAVVSRTWSASPSGKTGWPTASSCSGAECYDDDDDDDDDDDEGAPNNKKWNCYTVFVKEGLRDIHLTKDNWGRTMSMLASRWRSLSYEEREIYRAKARHHNAAAWFS